MILEFSRIIYANFFVLTPVRWFQVYVLKRPHVDEFLQKMGELFECVLFTASLAKVGAFIEVDFFFLSLDDTVCNNPNLNLVYCFTTIFFPPPVRWPCGRPAGPVGGVPRPALQGILCFPQRKLRQRPQPTGPRARQSHHHRQLTCLLHLPPRECSEFSQPPGSWTCSWPWYRQGGCVPITPLRNAPP